MHVDVKLLRAGWLLASLSLAASLASDASATSYAEPRPRDVLSFSGEYRLHFDPQTQRHDVYAQGEAWPKWSFTRPVGRDDYFVSNDGQFVAWVAWRFCRVEDLADPAVIVYSPTGVVVSHTYRDLCRPRRLFPWEIGPIGSFWRLWRAEAYMSGDVVVVNTVGLGVFRLVLVSPCVTNAPPRRLTFVLPMLALTAIGTVAWWFWWKRRKGAQ